MVGPLITLICDEARRIWCYRWLAAVTSALIFCAGTAFVLQLRPVYDAWGQVFVSKQTPVTAAAQGVSLMDDSYGSAYVVAKTLLNDERLERIVRKINPSASGMSKAEVARAVAGLNRRIQVTPDQGDGFFEVHFKDGNPRRAQRVVQLLLRDFVSRNVNRNQAQLQQAGEFLDGQIALYDSMLADSRTRMTDFLRSHPRVSASRVAAPDADGAGDFAAVNSAQDVVAQVTAQDARRAPPSPEVTALQSRLATLRSQYTEQYPDVAVVKRQLADAVQRDEEAHLATASQSRRSVHSRRAAPRRRVAPPSPEVQSEWAELQKNDEVLRINYQQLVARREAARLSTAVYTAEGSGKYQVTRQPTTPQIPIGPNRWLFMGGVFIAALGGGLAVAYLRAAMRGIFVSPRELEQTFQLPVIGTVSWEPAWCTTSPDKGGAFAAMRAAIFGARRAAPKPASSNLRAS